MYERHILIVGAGPTGLMLATELARLGVSAHIIEKRREPTSTSKALAVFARSLELLERVGVLDEAIAGGTKLRGAIVHAGDRQLASISTDGLDSPFPFILALPQSQTEHILEKRAKALGVHIEREVTLQSIEQHRDSVTAHTTNTHGSTSTKEFDWVIGCDGAHSTVREQSDIAFDGDDLHQSFMFADARVHWDATPDHVNAFFSPSGVVAAIPLPGEGMWRVIVSLPEGERAPSDPSLEEIQAMVQERIGKPVPLSHAVWLSGFEVRQRKVECYRSGRVLLAGDAAHAHSPVGGQGMNTGLQDASNLAWKLAMVSGGEADASLLNSYNEEREPIARELLRGTGLATRMVSLHSSIAQSIRNSLMQFALGFEAVQDRIVETISEMRIDYRGCVLARDEAHAGNVRAGDRAPDASLKLIDGKTVRIFEVLRDAGFHLFVFADRHDDSAHAFAEVARGHTAALSAVPVTVHEVALAGSEQATVRYDTDGEATAVLIRPDGYIGLRLQPLSIEHLDAYLALMRGEC